MTSYLLRRFLLVFPTLIGITAVVFFVMALSPGGIGGSLINKTGGIDAESARAIEQAKIKKYGLDRSLLIQYLRWLNLVSPIGFEAKPDGTLGKFKPLKTPDLGESPTRGRPVITLIAEALPITLLLNLVTIPIIYTISVYTGLRAARHRGGVFDWATGVAALALWSIPVIWAGVMLFGIFVNQLHWFPTGGLHDTLADSMVFLPSYSADGVFQRGWLLDVVWHLVLPVLCLTYGGFAFLSKLTRAAVLENLRADFARTAKAKGLDDRTVLMRHVFRNSLLPLITVAAHILPGLLAGSIVVEYIFNISGMGNLMISAVKAKDFALVLGDTLLAGLLGLVSYLIADICYALADPRVSYE
jgi:ABC-type dipeptide/oligopeptide/nickel transport system permease component